MDCSGLLIVSGMLVAIFSTYVAVCAYDPSDPASIMIAQLKLQEQQLALNQKIIEQQNEQLKVANEQIALLRALDWSGESIVTTVFISVASSLSAMFALWLIQRVLQYLLRRYQKPEMAQTTPQLMDFAGPSYQMDDIGHLRSVHISKSPAEYLSCDSGEE